MSAPIAGMCCQDCLYFERTDERFGECRRHAPQPNASYYVPKMQSVGSVHIDSHWPKVYNSNWCGQFGKRKKIENSQQKAPPGKTVVAPPVHHEGEEELKLQPIEPEKKKIRVPEVIIED